MITENDECVVDSQEPTCSKYTIPWTTPYQEKDSQTKTNERKHGHPVRNSNINETTLCMLNHGEKDGLLHQCHLCNKTVKSATGLKLHIRSCLKKVNFQKTTVEFQFLTGKNETNSLHQNNCSLKSKTNWMLLHCNSKLEHCKPRIQMLLQHH